MHINSPITGVYSIRKVYASFLLNRKLNSRRHVLFCFFHKVASFKTLSILLIIFIPNGLFFLNSLHRSISNLRGVGSDFIITMFYRDSCVQCKQCRPWSDAAVSDLGLHSLLMSLLWDARLKWVKQHYLFAFKSCVALRKHAYSNTLKILPPKMAIFQIKNSDSFHISAQKHRLWVLVRTASPRRF